jgi:erythromycin esterase-like protein
MSETKRAIVEALRRSAFVLRGGPDDFNALLSQIGNARFVLIGEASHGTHEFYRIRSEITKRLIREAGFRAVAVEADWPDAYRINRFVQGVPGDSDSTESLGGFERFPQWMWRNADVLDFVGWLRAFNDNLAANKPRTGFYGLDLYSMHASIRSVLEYLRTVDETAAGRALARYSCFDHFGADPQEYGYAAALGLSKTCESEAVEQLVELQRSAAEYARLDGRLRPDDTFFAEQNARLVRNAERYYRSMFDSRQSSWNLRDRHMVEMLGELVAFLDRSGTAPAKIVVWAHNSHLGDARATLMGEQG